MPSAPFRQRLLRAQRIVPDNLDINIGRDFLDVVDQIVGKAVVIIDDEDHGSRRPFRRV